MSLKNLDQHNRWRSKTVAFRMSPEENGILDFLVSISGLTKQDYITDRLLNREITVIPNSRVQKALRNNMLLVYGELKRVRKASEVSPDMEESIQALTKVFMELGDENYVSEVEQTEQTIHQLERS